jgi:hypothetical protein
MNMWSEREDAEREALWKKVAELASMLGVKIHPNLGLNVEPKSTDEFGHSMSGRYDNGGWR